MTKLVDLAEWVLLGSVEALDAVSGLSAPAARRIHHGDVEDVPWDNCCETGGQLVVAVGEMFPVGRFPAPDLEPGCSGPFGVPINVELVQCAATMNRQGTPPTFAVQHGEARNSMDAGYVLACWFRAHLRDEGIITGMNAPPTDGGCRATRLKLTMYV